MQPTRKHEALEKAWEVMCTCSAYVSSELGLIASRDCRPGCSAAWNGALLVRDPALSMIPGLRSGISRRSAHGMTAHSRGDQADFVSSAKAAFPHRREWGNS
jgi:hypothetical protein